LKLVDAVTVQVGLQESDLDNMIAVINLNGMSAVNWPWKLITSDNFAMYSDHATQEESFTITQDCDVDPNDPDEEMCIQGWNLAFKSEKVCEGISKYDMDWYGEHPDGRVESLLYTVRIAQQAICGIIMDDAPLDGTLTIQTDDTYSEISSQYMFPVGSTVYFLMTLIGISPIESVALLGMTLGYGGEEHRIGGVGLDAEWNRDLRLNPGIPKSEYENPINEKNLLMFSLYLHELRITNPGMGDIIAVTVRVEVTYAQGDLTGRRRELFEVVETWDMKYPGHKEFSLDTLEFMERNGIKDHDMFKEVRRQLQEGIGSDFGTEFGTMPATCEGTELVDQGFPDFANYITVQADQWAEIKCNQGGSIYVKCEVSGWDMQNVRDQCDVPVEIIITTTPEPQEEGLPWWIFILLGILLCCFCCFLLVCCRKDKRQTHHKKIFVDDFDTPRASSRQSRINGGSTYEMDMGGSEGRESARTGRGSRRKSRRQSMRPGGDGMIDPSLMEGAASGSRGSRRKSRMSMRQSGRKSMRGGPRPSMRGGPRPSMRGGPRPSMAMGGSRRQSMAGPRKSRRMSMRPLGPATDHDPRALYE
jgi:hypothetical protein